MHSLFLQNHTLQQSFLKQMQAYFLLLQALQ